MIDNLKRTLILAASTLAICIVPALATPIPTCDNTTDNLASVYLVTGYECQVGDKIFSDFQYTPSGNAAVAADEVTVEGIGPAGTAGIGLTSTLFPNDYGLQFAAPWTANSGQNSDALISFVVTVVNGAGMAITDAGLDQTGGTLPNGSATVVESGCSGVVVPCTQEWGVLTNTTNFATDTIISPTGSVSVSKDILVSGGNGANSFATISGVQDLFSQSPVPEPRALSLLLALGLVAGFAFRKKFQSVRG